MVNAIVALYVIASTKRSGHWKTDNGYGQNRPVIDAPDGEMTRLLKPSRQNGIMASFDFLLPYTKLLFVALFEGIANDFKNLFD